MSKLSILFAEGSEPVKLRDRQPVCFVDLNLDSVVNAITANKDEYDLRPFFYTPLASVAAIEFRQAVMRDLELPANLQAFKAFAKRMQAVREAIVRTGKRHHPLQKMRWFVDGVMGYGETIVWLSAELSRLPIGSVGLSQIRDYVVGYAASQAFGELMGEARAISEQLSGIRYDIINRGLQVEVLPHAGQPDYGAQVAALFDRFDRKGSKGSKDYAFESAQYADVNAVEGNILTLVAQTHKAVFDRLAEYCRTASAFLDETVVRFDREIQFYISYLDHIAQLREHGITFCYPHIRADSKAVRARDGVDLALAGKLATQKATPVPNDFRLDGAERILVVTGPNQGGKTTFSRLFAQLHYLGSLGCLVPATEAELYLPDQIFTHFERAESMTNLTGKLQDDLERIHDILRQATPRSIVIINEIFASTTLSDAIMLSRKIGDHLARLDVLCVWVTFIDEISTLNEKTVSMVSAVDPDMPERRTFKIERRAANGLAYALSLARKYRLTREQILDRVRA